MTSDILKASQIIGKGGLVVFPSETVYGIGANACNQDACLKIFQAKNRPVNNPLIVHVNSVSDAEKLVNFNEDAHKLSALWPGPLTLVLPKKLTSKLAPSVTGGLETVAIRIPSDPVARKLIDYSKVPIAAPSANKSGKLSPTSYDHVKNHFDGHEVFILPSEEKSIYGLESTIVDLSANTPTILRFGFITPDIIASILEKDIAISGKNSAIKAPGMMYRHYAPSANVRLNAKTLNDHEVGLNFGNSNLTGDFTMNLSKTGDLAQAAANLFDFLHKLDEIAQKNSKMTIAIAPIPNENIGLAINDRLLKAAHS